jgi:hypothetical protein
MGQKSGENRWQREVSEAAVPVIAAGSRKGDAAEAEFVARACALNWRIAKPWGNIDPYDVLVGMGCGFWRVQVKCTYRRWRYGSETSMSSSRRPFTKDEIDFVAAWVLARNIWYIVPVEEVEGRRHLYFHPEAPDRKGNRDFEKYREAWCLLMCQPKARGWKDIPVLCRCRKLPTRCAVCPNK